MKSTRQTFVNGKGELFFAVLSVFLPALFIWGATAHMQGRRDSQSQEKQTIKPTVKVSGRGLPGVVLRDGRELAAGNGAADQGAQPVALASADFDSDGVSDLVTADQNGTVKFYRGNIDSLHPNSPEAKRRRELGQLNEDPFYSTNKVFSLSVRPDFLAAGDFNADGHKDILASARGGSSLHLLAGNGKGNFAADRVIQIEGSITALATGEIGRADGQTDVAVAVITSDGPKLFVYEHPEGAFTHKAEVFPLSAPATEIVLGDLDGDHYSDIAVATGNVLTIIHERGQAYPWDMIKGMDIQRPPAIVATRTMPFTIAGLAIGEFGNQRGNSLAMLAADGSLYTLEANKAKTSNIVLSKAETTRYESPSFVPSGVDAKGVAVRTHPVLDAETAKANGLMTVDSSQGHLDINELMKKSADEAVARLSKMTREERAKLKAEGHAQAEVQRQRAKSAFLHTISAQPSTLAQWNLQTMTTDSALSSGGSSSALKLIAARVSVSGKDDLVVVDSASNRLNIVAQNPQSGSRNSQPAEVVALDVTGGPTAVLPMRLNSDALSDLVVLRNGASEPSIVMTAAASTFTVNDAGDGTSDCVNGPTCTLRNAIQLANANPGSTVAFNIPGGGVHTISPLSELPKVTANGTVIDGQTQPGFSNFPLIEIKGNLIPSGTAADGLKIGASNCKVYGLVINEFPGTVDSQGSTHGGNGLTSESLSDSQVNGHNLFYGNFLGTDPTGTIAKPNPGTGLLVFDSDNNTIDDNLISGNAGAGLDLTNGNQNIIVANLIGVAISGNDKLGNAIFGVFLTGANNQFGGDDPDQGNTVSGNGKARPPGDPNHCDGVGMLIPVLINTETGVLLTALNLLKGNKIGTNSSGTQAVANCSQGIETEPLTQTIIGSITQNGRNIVSGNDFNAIFCTDFGFDPSTAISEGGFCAIIGNNIGTDITGTVSIPNTTINGRSGFQALTGIVEIQNNLTLSNFGAPGGTTPGGACTGFCNLLSGNNSPNSVSTTLLRDGFGTFGVFNSYIGTNLSGNQALSNEQGVLAIGAPFGNSSDTFIGAVGFPFAAPGTSLGNLISGNEGSGVFITSFTGVGSGNSYTVEANLIGTDAGGLNAIPNGGGGVSVVAIFEGTVQIGDIDPLERNIISGNGGGGLGLQQNPGADIRIVNNYIGVNKAGAPLGNSGDGISFVNLGGATIGGASAAEENLIQNNGGAGVLLASNVPAQLLPRGVDIQRNKIKNNGALGIDLSKTFAADGVTPNDCLDVDDGPNGLQNFPLLAAPVFNGDGTVTVPGTLFSHPNETYRVDFYANTAADATGYGEGEDYIGTKTVTTNVHGKGTFTFTSANPVPSGQKITATATDGERNTSEFSCVAGQCDNTEPTCPDALIVNDAGDNDNDPSDPNVCDVSPPNQVCTLRAAITVANHLVSVGGKSEEFIEFNIPGTGVQIISPATPLPAVANKMTIDATSQPGYNATPVIELDGSNAGAGVDGLKVTGGFVVIHGMGISDFAGGNGIRIEAGPGGNKVQSCFIGTNPGGTALAGNMAHGILINNSAGNTIGGSPGSSSFEGNLFGGSTNANVLIQGASSQNNIVTGNEFDVSFDGQTLFPNPGAAGVTITTGAHNNTVGGTSDIATNHFSSELYGILLTEGATGNRVTFNEIDNCHIGVSITRASNNTVGGPFATASNVVANCEIGIYLSDTDPTPPDPAEARDRLFAQSGKTSRQTTARRSSLGPALRPEISLNSQLRRESRAGIVSVQATTTGNTIQGNVLGVPPGVYAGQQLWY